MSDQSSLDRRQALFSMATSMVGLGAAGTAFSLFDINLRAEAQAKLDDRYWLKATVWACTPRNETVSSDGRFKLTHSNVRGRGLLPCLDGQTPVRLTNVNDSCDGIFIASHASCAPCLYQE